MCVRYHRCLELSVFFVGGSSLLYKVPVNIKRLVWNAKKLFHIKSHGESDMSPTYVIRRVHELCQGLITVTGDDALSAEAQDNATLLFKILVKNKSVSSYCFTRRSHGAILSVGGI